MKHLKQTKFLKYIPFNKELGQQKQNLTTMKFQQKKNRRKRHEVSNVLELEINKWKQNKRDKLHCKTYDPQFVVK